MKKLLLALLALCAHAQVTITVGTVNSITDTSARVNATLSGSAAVYAQFGDTTSYGYRSSTFQGDADNVVVNITGLRPGSVNNYRLCQTGHTPPTGCTANQTVTTLFPQTTEPTAPAAVTTTYPSSFTTTYNVASDCSDLQMHINTARGQDGNNNYLVSIPAGTVCAGLITLGAKSGVNPTGTGTIVIATAGTLPPAGSRITSDYSAQMATILQNTIPDSSGVANPGTCTPRTYFYRTDLTAYQVCTATNTWTAVSATTGYTSGASAPVGACTAGYYYWRTGVGTNGLYYCHAAGVWINIRPAGDGRFTVAVPDRYSASAVHGYRLVGLKFENADEQFVGSNPTVVVESGSNRVLIDRCWVATQTAAASNGIQLNGANVGIIDSYLDIRFPGSGGQGVNITSGTGPFVLTNNYLRTTGGIGVFINDNGTTVPRADFTITRNTMAFSPRGNPASGSYDGLGNRDTRSLIEAKRGTKMLIDGNIFENYYTYALAGGVALLLSPRANNSTGGDDNAYQISDLTITDNTFRSGTGGIEIWGSDDQGYRNTRVTTRVNISNNLAYNVDGANSANGAVRGHWLYVQDGLEHLAVRNNTLIDVKGTGPAFLNIAGGPIRSGRIENNIWWLNHGAAGGGDAGGGIRWSDSRWSSLCDGSTTASSASAATKLSTCVLDGVFRNNIIVGGQAGDTSTYTSTYPSGNTWPGDTTTGITAIGFRDYAGGDYALKFSSTYAPAGVGVDMAALLAAQGAPTNARALSITSSGATVYWTAPDTSTACTVEYGTSSTPGTGSRVTDTPTSRFRSRALTGLSSSTTYYYRVYCGQMTSGSFRTN